MAARPMFFISIAVRLILAVVIFVIAIVIFSALARSRPVPERSSLSTPPPVVPVFEVQSASVARQWTGFGTAQAVRSADVPARVGATVVSIPREVDEGFKVDPGGMLVALDADDFQRDAEVRKETIADLAARLEQLAVEESSLAERAEIARRQVELAEADLERFLMAADRGAAATSEVDRARQALNTAVHDQVMVQSEVDQLAPRRIALGAQKRGQEASLERLMNDVTRCRIAAPELEGVEHWRIAAVDVEVGENVMVGQRVARLIDPSLIEVPIRLPAAARRHVNVGASVVLTATGSGERSWDATVSRLAPIDDAERRTMTVYVELEQDPSEPGALAPGRFVSANVQALTTEPTTPLPRRAVDADHVLLVEEGVIRLHRIRVSWDLRGRREESGIPDEDWVIPTEPLPAGSLVVLTPSRRLAAGVSVQPSLPGDGS